MSTINMTALIIEPAPAGLSPMDEFMHTYSSYLRFVSQLPHLLNAEIETPPASGRTNFTRAEEVLRSLGKSPSAIDLLRRVPFINDGPIAGNQCRQVEWHDESNELRLLINTTPENLDRIILNRSLLNPPGYRLAPHEVLIVDGARDETDLIVNSVTGQVHAFSRDSVVPENAEDVKPTGPEAWRILAPAQNVEPVLEDWRRQWLDLVWISDPEYYLRVRVEGYEDEDEFEAIKRVYEECGWPERFDRNACMARLAAL